MEEGFSLALRDSTIGIFGLGLMGGSIALGLKGHCHTLIGFDSHLPTLELALSKKIIDHASADSAALLPQVDLLILATPVQSIINIIQHLPSLMPNSCIVLDLGSTKQNIVQAMSTLPERFDPVGGHPICGKEELGLENADPNLYQTAPFVITPLERTTQRAKSAVKQVILTIGAHLIEMTAEEHDCILASTSHLPFLLSSALAHSTPQEFGSLIGPGFRSASRLAGTPSHMMMDILQSNRQNVLQSLLVFRESLDRIESAIENEDTPTLATLLDESRHSYENLLHPNR
ncbi:MAG: prephenate dehydrogenase [Anaerolineales bacterium]|nr:prephenate dehydrogenase [Anaerolineales bacterium]